LVTFTSLNDELALAPGTSQITTINGGLITTGQLNADLIEVGTLDAARIGADSIDATKFAGTLESDGFDPDTGIGWQIKMDGSTIFRDMDIRGELSAASRSIKTTATQSAPLQALTTQTFTNPGFSLGSSVGTLTMSDLFYAPDHGSTGLVATRLARYETDIIITVLATQRISSGNTVLQVSVDGGTYTTIQTVPNPNASFAGQMMNFLHVYTTPASFDTIQFRVTNTAGVSTGYDQMYILAQANNF
jgi:hypothetical protein